MTKKEKIDVVLDHYKGSNEDYGTTARGGDPDVSWESLAVTTRRGETSIVAEGRRYDPITNKYQWEECPLDEDMPDDLVDGLYNEVMKYKSMLKR